MPSPYVEPKGLYLLEALAAGVPVVSPHHGALPEILAKTGGGITFPPNDVPALAKALGTLAGRSRRREETRRGRRRGRALALRRPPHGRTSPRGLRSSRLLKAADLVKEYRGPEGPLRILDGVSVDLEPGDALAVMGPSGSGKSTLLYILGTLDRPTSGLVTLSGADPFQLGEKELAAFRNRHIGFVFQDHCLLPQLSVLENVLVPTLVAPKARDHGARARTLLDRVGLAHRLSHRPSALSGGERQRVAIARALVLSPTVLLCDEPTGNLDRKAAHAVGSLLLELASDERAILVAVTHSPDLSERFPRRSRLEDGRLAAA